MSEKRALVSAVFLALLLAGVGHAATAPVPRTGATPVPAGSARPVGSAVSVTRYDWVDPARNRPVPVKIYSPASGGGPFPLIVFSHGLGGSRETYEYLGRYWAEHGYIAVHVQHPGSDEAVWRQNEHPVRSLRKAALDPRNAFARPLDVRFVLDRMTALNAEAGPFHGRIDLRDVGMAGHSFGAWTTLALAGQKFPERLGQVGDPRITAAVEMSAPIARFQNPDVAYGAIRIPILHLTGTRDDLPFGHSPAADRRVPFDHIRGADQYLVIFAGADHMAFAGLPFKRPAKADNSLVQSLTQKSTTAFWDAYLRHDAAARRWLSGGGFAAELGKAGRFELKSAPAR